MGDIGLELSAGSPGEAAVVGDLLGNGHERLDVGAGPTKEDQGDRALGGGSPVNGVGLAGRDYLVEAWLENGISFGGEVVVGLGVSRDQSRKGGDDRRKGETHYVCDIEVWVGG